MDRPIKETLQFINEGGSVVRYHTRPGLRNDTNAHHSHGVAMFCYLLCEEYEGHWLPKVSSTLLMAALTHDLAEQVASDVSAPAKRLLGIRDQLHKVESAALKVHWLDFEQHLTTEEANTLKLADTFDGMLYCCREIALGNKGVLLIWRRWISYVIELRNQGKMTDRAEEIYDAILSIFKENRSDNGPDFDCFC